MQIDIRSITPENIITQLKRQMSGLSDQIEIEKHKAVIEELSHV